MRYHVTLAAFRVEKLSILGLIFGKKKATYRVKPQHIYKH